MIPKFKIDELVIFIKCSKDETMEFESGQIEEISIKRTGIFYTIIYASKNMCALSYECKENLLFSSRDEVKNYICSYINEKFSSFERY